MSNYSDLMDALIEARKHELNIMIISFIADDISHSFSESTICELFFNGDKEARKTDVNSEDHLVKLELDKLTLWFSNLKPYYESSRFNEYSMTEARAHIIPKLHQIDDEEKPLIDLVLLVSSGNFNSFDFHSGLKKIAKDVVLPHFGNKSKLIFVKNCKNLPPNIDINFQKSIIENETKEKAWIKSNIGINADVIFCGTGGSGKPYNIAKLLYHMLKHVPTEKRLLFYENISTEHSIWDNNDSDYNKLIKQLWLDTNDKEFSLEELRKRVIEVLPQSVKSNPFFKVDFEKADLKQLKNLAKSDIHAWKQLSENVKSALEKI